MSRDAKVIIDLPPARPSGVKAVLARLPFDLGVHVPELVQPLVAMHKRTSPKADVHQIVRAHLWAQAVYEGRLRTSGELYVAHPVNVAETLADLGLDTPTIVAALLHDVVKDTQTTNRDLAAEFGAEVALLVEGVIRLDRLQATARGLQQAEALRKMLIGEAGDCRVLLIKLAERLQHMHVIHQWPRDVQRRMASETMEVYAPLAHRLGMQRFKTQLEDLAFATLHPKRCDEIKSMVRERQPERDRYMARVADEIEQHLRSVRIRAEISGRPRHYYSIYEKMVRRSKEFSEIYDVVGIRVIVGSVKDCYAALGAIHSRWHPIPLRFKDFIAMPKFNLYQSLHTTVVGPEGKTLEVQIRTPAMQRTADYGVAARWKYEHATGAMPPRMQQLSQTIDTTRPDIRLDLAADEVVVFTPHGDVKSLPHGSTPVDFAYAVHTEVGHRTIGARVNGMLVPLAYELHHGETVEIMTSKDPNAKPNPEWLEFVRSSRAKSKIRQCLSAGDAGPPRVLRAQDRRGASPERRGDVIEHGRIALRRELARHGMGWARLMTGSELSAVAADLHYADVDALYAAIGDGHRKPQQVAEHLLGRLADEDEADEPTIPTVVGRSNGGAEAVTIEGVPDAMVTLAQCCTPVLGDDVLGFVTRGRGVSVHRHDCSNAAALRCSAERLVDIVWDTSTPAVFRVTVQVEAMDRPHLLRDITTVLGDLHVNILSAQVTTRRDRHSKLRFAFELADIAHLDHILAQVCRVGSVLDAYRVVPGGTPVGH